MASDRYNTNNHDIRIYKNSQIYQFKAEVCRWCFPHEERCMSVPHVHVQWGPRLRNFGSSVFGPDRNGGQSSAIESVCCAQSGRCRARPESRTVATFSDPEFSESFAPGRFVGRQNHPFPIGATAVCRWADRRSHRCGRSPTSRRPTPIRAIDARDGDQTGQHLVRLAPPAGACRRARGGRVGPPQVAPANTAACTRRRQHRN